MILNRIFVFYFHLLWDKFMHMKRFSYSLLGLAFILATGCDSKKDSGNATTSPVGEGNSTASTSSATKDETSAPNVVQIAIGSKDHTTLVTAVKAADLVDDLSTTGPFTVFAPTNAAFSKLPAGTVEGLLKADKKEALTDILQYHVYVGRIKTENMQDGQVLNQVNGGNITISKKGPEIYINGKAKIIASIIASNGIVHVIDEVLLPPPAPAQ
jgi:uncharacterized surface protein with fasciclin (FAS1) repeats